MGYLLVTLLAALLFVEVNSINQCANNQDKHCVCFYNVDHEYQCPPFNFEILIHADPDQYLNIECNNLNNFNVDILPNFTAGTNISATFRYCPLPEDNFIPIFNKLHVGAVNQLKLENVTIPDTSPNLTISKNIFYHLSYLKDLTLVNIYYPLDDDILEYLPNLVNFEIDHSDVEDISTFKFPSSLKVLHLTGNLISDLPDGVFENLGKLFQLHLWSNNITHIRKGAFRGLENLLSLELSGNYIENIEEDSFEDLKALRTINIRGNKLTKISADLFKNNKNLTSIRLEDNPGLILPDYIFSNFQYLNTLKLKHSRIDRLPEHIFQNSSIEILMLQENRLDELPENIFLGLTKLTNLDLSKNRLISLPDNIFSSLRLLKAVNLGFNGISEINANLFSTTVKLEKLIINNNKITTVHPSSFFKLQNLLILDMSNNFYTMDVLSSEFNPFNIVSLSKLILKNNLIEVFPSLYSLHQLEEVDISFNKIKTFEVAAILGISDQLSTIDLSNNELEILLFNSVEESIIENRKMPFTRTHINLQNNPLTCSCGNYPLIRYCQGEMDRLVKTRLDFQLNGVYCAQPDIYRHIQISKLQLEQISCEIPITGCPTECKRFWRPYNNFTIFDCSHRNLTSFPRICEAKHPNIEMNLTGNDIRGGLNASLGYDNVKNLFLSDNKLQDLKWVPIGIEKLTLDRNELTHLDSDLLEVMNKTKNLETIKLSGNPWSCGCSALTLQIFIRDNYKKINSTDVICREDNKPLAEKKEQELCKSSLMLILFTVVPIFSFLTLTIISLVFYIYYRQEVKVWLFSKNLCLWFVSEDELDEDKVYDIFISYSNQDEEFVIQNLLPVLETGPKPFKTCIHVRDWEPGELIMTHVTNSVLNSRRTLVVLSNHFLESIWGKLEFKTAHMRAIEEGRARVIVVKYGELDESKLDDDLKAYLNTNTYIEWGKPWFWNKLKYALPHSHKNGFYKSNQKHAKVMLKIDDKFELTAPPLKHPESTPPVITLDPSLLKNHHPLNFHKPGADVSQLAETPLVVNA